MTPTLPKSAKDPTPLYFIAGAGDLAVEKIRELSKLASDKVAEMDSDPAAVSDRVQVGLEERADALSAAVRDASNDLMIQFKGLSEKAQSALQSALQAALEQAGETYSSLAGRGEEVVERLREQQAGHELEPAAPAPTTAPPTPRKKTATPARKTTTRSTAKKTSPTPRKTST